MKITSLTPTIGAIVEGVDLRDLPRNPGLVKKIHELWMRHLVLFFRDQQLLPQEHLALGECFGSLHIHPAAPYAQDIPALMKIHTDAQSHRNNGEVWHSDVSADQKPPMASILHIHQVPEQGGDTLWANMYAVYESFSESIQELLLELSAVHMANYDGFYGSHTAQRENPRAIHPVVRTHPVTKRRALFVNSGFTCELVGLTSNESRAILDMLFERIRDPIFQCRFQWTKNAVAMWDNRCTQHMALWDYFPETRSGFRVTVSGDRPFLIRSD
jgi:taurine dioxygenase